jgi:hypothetical protein
MRYTNIQISIHQYIHTSCSPQCGGELRVCSQHYTEKLQPSSYHKYETLLCFMHRRTGWGGGDVPLKRTCKLLMISIHSTVRSGSFGLVPGLPGRGTSPSQGPISTSQHNTEGWGQTFIRREGFEPTISASKRSKDFASDRAATGTGSQHT